jgi:hypothetical protein
LKCDGPCAETRFLLSAKGTSPFKSAGASVQSTTGSRGVRISGSNAGYTMLRGSVKSTGNPLHSPVFPSLPLACVTVCRHISTRSGSFSAISNLEYEGNHSYETSRSNHPVLRRHIPQESNSQILCNFIPVKDLPDLNVVANTNLMFPVHTVTLQRPPNKLLDYHTADTTFEYPACETFGGYPQHQQINACVVS